MNSMLHRQGEWMAGIRLMTVSGSENRSGRRALTDDQVFARGYEMAPQRMTMLMPAVDIMYGATERLTLTASLPFTFNSMDMRMMEGESFVMRSGGVGDLRAGALIGLWRGRRQDLFLSLGAQLPLGKVDAKDDVPDCFDCKVDYPMQPGSGTFDVTPGLTWVRDGNQWSWGASWLSVLRTGTNSESYRLGNRHDVAAWGVRRLYESVSGSVRITASRWGNVRGADPDLDPSMAPTQDPSAQGGRRMDLAVGLAIKPRVSPSTRHRLAVEIGRPILQSLDGPQLAGGLSSTVSWQLWWY